MKVPEYTPHYIKVGKALLEDGNITLPLEWTRKLIEKNSDTITINFKNKKYNATLSTRPRKGYSAYGQLHLSSHGANSGLLVELRKEFIYSYMMLQGLMQKKLEAKEKKGSLKLKGSPQEVLVLTPCSSKKLRLASFVQIEETALNPLFRKLAEEDVFGWLFDKEKKAVFGCNSEWFSGKGAFEEHATVGNIIYYLRHTKEKKIYIGKTTKTLGKRISFQKKHQGMPKGWDSFRYDQIIPKYSKFLEQIEGHTIKAIGSFIKKCKGYELVNKIGK